MEENSKQLSGGSRVSVKGNVGAASKIEVSLDSTKPKIKLKLKNKVIGHVDFEEVISNSLDANAMNKAFLKRWKAEFDKAGIIMEDFLNQTELD
jgi:hypothetical protein